MSLHWCSYCLHHNATSRKKISAWLNWDLLWIKHNWQTLKMCTMSVEHKAIFVGSLVVKLSGMVVAYNLYSRKVHANKSWHNNNQSSRTEMGQRLHLKRVYCIRTKTWSPFFHAKLTIYQEWNDHGNVRSSTPNSRLVYARFYVYWSINNTWKWYWETVTDVNIFVNTGHTWWTINKVSCMYSN